MSTDKRYNSYVIYNIVSLLMQAVVVAEWLRRWTRNPLGSSRAGSNPADNALSFFFFIYSIHAFKDSGVIWSLCSPLAATCGTVFRMLFCPLRKGN